jgi:hypothetical protein
MSKQILKLTTKTEFTFRDILAGMSSNFKIVLASVGEM